MSPLPNWPPHAQQEAWFAAWLRAVRSGVPGSADVAAAQLRLLGVEIHAVTVPPSLPGNRPGDMPRPAALPKESHAP